MSYRIGSFNMYKFSLQSDETLRKSMMTIGAIIRDNFDIVAIQEIFTPAALKYQLLKTLGPTWDGRWAQPRSGSPQAAEGYAFVWNKKRFKLAEDLDERGDSHVAEPSIVENYHVLPGYERLIRDPFFGRFTPIHGPFFELRLLNTHVRYSAGASEENASIPSQSTIKLRQHEVETLITRICDKKCQKRTGNHRAAYVILLGDYNLNLPVGSNPYPYVQEYYVIVDGNAVKQYRTVQIEKTTLKQNEDKTDSDKYANNYDHFTYDENYLVNRLGISLIARRIDTLNDYCSGDVKQHRIEISDHVPIMLEMWL